MKLKNVLSIVVEQKGDSRSRIIETFKLRDDIAKISQDTISKIINGPMQNDFDNLKITFFDDALAMIYCDYTGVVDSMRERISEICQGVEDIIVLAGIAEPRQKVKQKGRNLIDSQSDAWLRLAEYKSSSIV